MLAGSLQEEEEGIVASGEGRVIKINKAVDPPANARADSEIICEIARRLGKGQYFPLPSTREIFEELREASQGGYADYYGITYERIEKEMGIFWPCPHDGSSGNAALLRGRTIPPSGRQGPFPSRRVSSRRRSRG